MAVTQTNEYQIGVNNDLGNLANNVDYNRIGEDLTWLELDGGVIKVSVGSFVESQGNLYVVDTAAETPAGTPGDGAYLFFDEAGPGFVWSTTAGTFDPTRGGIYDASDRRQCRWQSFDDTAYKQLHQPADNEGYLAEITNGIGIAQGAYQTSGPRPVVIPLSHTQTEVVFLWYDSGNDRFRHATYNLKTGSLTNTATILAANISSPCALDGTSIAAIDSGSLQKFRYNGADWVKEGSALSLGFTAHRDMVPVTDSRVLIFGVDGAANIEYAAYDFSGSGWTIDGSIKTISSFDNEIAALKITKSKILLVEGSTTNRLNLLNWDDATTTLTLQETTKFDIQIGSALLNYGRHIEGGQFVFPRNDYIYIANHDLTTYHIDSQINAFESSLLDDNQYQRTVQDVVYLGLGVYAITFSRNTGEDLTLLFHGSTARSYLKFNA